MTAQTDAATNAQTASGSTQPPPEQVAAVDAIVSEFMRLSPDEWLLLASHKMSPRGRGVNPMWQLQQRLRDNPRTFGEKLWGMFAVMTANGSTLLLREFPWPRHWPLARQLKFNGRFARTDLWARTELLLDQLEYAAETHGVNDKRTRRLSRMLVSVCAE